LQYRWRRSRYAPRVRSGAGCLARRRPDAASASQPSFDEAEPIPAPGEISPTRWSSAPLQSAIFDIDGIAIAIAASKDKRGAEFAPHAEP
jgi:hypothetical protein